MNVPSELRNQIVDFGLVTASFVLSWLVGVLGGGWKFGRLERRLALQVDRSQLAAFLERLQLRLAELGFRPGAAPGQFVQGGAEFGDLSSFTHAKTSKQLTLTVSGAEPQPARVELSLHYLDPIAADTGESAYRDAVLDYVSGRADEMKVVPNRSFAAVCSFVGGLCTWIALLGLKALHFEPLFQPVLVMGGTYVVLGLLAVLIIAMKPGQLTGTWLAVAGIVAAASALAFGAALTHGVLR